MQLGGEIAVHVGARLSIVDRAVRPSTLLASGYVGTGSQATWLENTFANQNSPQYEDAAVHTASLAQSCGSARAVSTNRADPPVEQTLHRGTSVCDLVGHITCEELVPGRMSQGLSAMCR